jgi:hypothetical protein
MQRPASAVGRQKRTHKTRDLQLVFGVAFVLALVGGWALPVADARAEPIATQEQPAAGDANNSGETAAAGNGGTATSTSGGEVQIGQIVTGENTGNAITTGDVSGSAEIAGGDIDYPVNVNVSLNNAPLVADASGGDSNEAVATDKDEAANQGGNADVKIVNENDNRSSADITLVPAP